MLRELVLTSVDGSIEAMGMFGKAFESMYTGSMFGSPALDFSVMGYVIACQRPRKGDGECFVELNPLLLAAMFSTSEQDVIACIERLCSPDARSRSPAEEGRRLIAQTNDQKPAPGPTTYWVVNGKRYREMASEEERREYLRLAKQRERAAKKKTSTPVNKRRRRSTKSTQAEAEIRSRDQSTDPTPPTPLPGVDGLSDYGPIDLAQDFRELTGSTSLRADGQYSTKQRDALFAILEWARCEHPGQVREAIRQRLRWGSADTFLRRSPIHVWAERIGAIGPPEAAKGPAAVSTDDWDEPDDWEAPNA